MRSAGGRKLTLRELFFDPIRVSGKQSSGGGRAGAGSAWPLARELLHWTRSRQDVWRLEDAVRGTVIFGNTGSGKTSGSGRQIAKSFLRAGLGGLVLCVKEGEAAQWCKLLSQEGRAHDLIRIAPDEPNSYNFIDHEARATGRPAGLTDNIASLLVEVMTLLDRSSQSQGGSQDPFWERTMMQMLKNAIVLQRAAFGKTTIAGLLAIINSAPRGFMASGLSQWDLRSDPQNAEFGKILGRADELCPVELRDELELAKTFFLNEFARLADRTRSIVVTSFSSMADSLLRPPLNRLLCQETTVTPELAFDGKIIVIDLAVHTYRQVGTIANLVWKIGLKRACEARRDPDRPVFLWVDECQYLLDKADAAFASTARSTKCCVVAITQNLPILYQHMGGASSDVVESLLGCLHTKIFHQQDDPKTNHYASEVVQKVLRDFQSETKRSSLFSSPAPKTMGTSQQWDYDVPERAYTLLRSGGVEDRFVVEALVYESGRYFSNRKPWLKVAFNQRTDAIIL